jgi:hypothetical protein
MNPETHFLIKRPYLEVVDDILTALVGGVVNEAIEFDVKFDLYRLSQPAQDVRGITGTLEIDEGADEEHHSFLKGIDFELSEGDNAVVWVEGGDRPKDETTFFVDYFRPNSRSPITDINVGGVARTLGEAIGREIATVYEQINQAYRSGFLETAQGKSLDLVVSILGITRKTADFATGLVTFFRDPTVSGAIAIPQGLALQTAEGDAFFETTEPRVLQAGQVRIDAPVRAAVGFGGEKGIVPAGAITAMVQPLAGINRVTNFDATTRAAEDETDVELKARARAALRALGKATLAALDRVIREGRGNPVEYWDPNSPPAKRSDPGTVSFLVEAEPERLPSLNAAVQETRAAGVLATLVARYVFFRPRMVVEVSPVPETAAGKEKVKAEIIAALQAYVDGLSSGDPALGSELDKAAKKVKEVKKVLFKDVITWRSDVGRPAAQVLADTLFATVKAVPASAEGDQALQEAITRVLQEAEPTAPTGSRTPDRSLLEGVAAAAGKRAGDTEIGNAEFQVAATVDGEPWFAVLDMGPEDIVFSETVGAN